MEMGDANPTLWCTSVATWTDPLTLLESWHPLNSGSNNSGGWESVIQMVTSIYSGYKLEKQNWNLNSVLSRAVAIRCGWLFRFKWIKVEVKLNFNSSVLLAHYKHSVAICSYQIAQHRSGSITGSTGQCWTRLTTAKPVLLPQCGFNSSFPILSFTHPSI